MVSGLVGRAVTDGRLDPASGNGAGGALCASWFLALLFVPQPVIASTRMSVCMYLPALVAAIAFRITSTAWLPSCNASPCSP